MKIPAGHRAFSLVELLVVIAIIGILASLAVTGISSVNTRVKISRARLQMAQLGVALKEYEQTDGNFPFSQAVPGTGTPDFTYGAGPVRNGGGHETDNRELAVVLTAITQYRDGSLTRRASGPMAPITIRGGSLTS